jgi:arginase
VKDYGDIETVCEDTATVQNMTHLPLVSACNQKLSQKVSEILQDGRVAVTIGGDHSIGVGKDICLYKIDAVNL